MASISPLTRCRQYYSLTKPGVLYGNALTAAAGFLLASNGIVHWGLFVALLLGSTLVIASACVINNFLDQDIDAKMTRTKKRALVSKEIPGSHAVILGSVLGILGFFLLILYTNPLVVILGAIGIIDYVVLYGMLGKRMSMHGTLVGCISGAIPIISGYVGVTGTIDTGAIIVFLILFFWQIPEFYSIAIYRHDEYKAAGIPVISVVKGIGHTKLQISIYTLLFAISTMALYVFGYVGLLYLIVMGALNLWWLRLAVQGLFAKDVDTWARKMFKFSLIILLVFCLMISLRGFVPYA